MSSYVDAREVMERIKDIISKDVKGNVYDYHVADTLKIPYSTLRIKIMKDEIPHEKVLDFCCKNELNVNELLFKD